jgi:nicotinate-nucleotide adenylyltransferase
MPGFGNRPARVGVFGGTFDPVHTGHLIVATELQHALELDRVLFVPTGNPPHKADQDVSANADRLAMLELAIAGNPSFAISTLELDRAGPSYTADLLTMLQAEMPDTQLVFLMGEDSLRDLPTWHQPETIVALAELGVAIRPEIETDLEQIYRRLPGARGRITIVSTTLIGISSSALRRMVLEGAPIRYQVPAAVEEYIMTSEIYRLPASPTGNQ